MAAPSWARGGAEFKGKTKGVSRRHFRPQRMRYPRVHAAIPAVATRPPDARLERRPAGVCGFSLGRAGSAGVRGGLWAGAEMVQCGSNAV